MCLKYFQTNKLCYCFPPRYQLLVWGYSILIFSLINLCIISLTIQLLSFNDDALTIIRNMIYILLMLTEEVVTVLLIVGAHTKNVAILKLYYIGFIAIFILLILHTMSLGLHCVYYVYQCLQHSLPIFRQIFTIWRYVLLVVILFLQVFMNAYVLLLVRSEIEKLETDAEVELSNVAAKDPVNLPKNIGYSEDCVQDPFNVYDYKQEYQNN